MKTVKQVSDITGISVRALHYYDEIGLLKPSKITDAGYRLYDDKALETLQQILFFKELGISLKEVKEIMASPNFDRMKALENQKKLLILKRNRLNDLIELVNKTLKGEGAMSFKEFDMTEYYNVLEEFKKENIDKIIKYWGSVDKFNEFIEHTKAKESNIASMAIKQYGSIKKYSEAIKKNLTSSNIFDISDQYDKYRNDCLAGSNPKLKELYEKMVSDLSKDSVSAEIQKIAGEITSTSKNNYELFQMDDGDDHWYYMVQSYLLNTEWTKAVDEKYGNGACKFIGTALNTYLGDKKPESLALYEKLTADLSKDPYSDEVQEIVEKIAALTRKTYEALNSDMGDNYWNLMSELCISKPERVEALDKKYGSGASKFISEAFKCYSEKEVQN